MLNRKDYLNAMLYAMNLWLVQKLLLLHIAMRNSLRHALHWLNYSYETCMYIHCKTTILDSIVVTPSPPKSMF